MARRPNVVLFISHDTGCHVSPYGVTSVHTPNLERLTREGIRCSRSFCTSPLCSPSRAALVTGRYPHQNGVRGLTGNLTGGFGFHRQERHAARIFRDAGYESVLCGFEHESPDWRECGFERAISGSGGPYNHSGDLRNQGHDIDRWLRERDPSQPFYLQVGCHETHRDFTKFDTPPDESLGLAIPPYLNDFPEVRRELAEFQGAIRRLDDGVGRILGALDATGVADDTIVIVTTDHGIDFPRAKGTLYDAGLSVFLFMRYPRRWPSGLVIEHMVSNVDVLPTLLDACDIPRADSLAGRSFLGAINGSGYQPHDAIYAEKDYHDTFDPTRAIRTERYKYIRYFEVNLFQDLRLATMTRRHFFKQSWRRTGLEELYDLAADPGEFNNLAEDAASRPVLESMRERLVDWMKHTGDPLLQHRSGSPFYAHAMDELLGRSGDSAR